MEAGTRVISITSVSPETDRYLEEPLAPATKEIHVYSWRAENESDSHLAILAGRYVSAPLTSVSSERLLSCARDIHSAKVSSLALEGAESY